MNLSSFFRPPLLWLVVVEIAVVTLLGAVTWHVWLEHAPAPAAALPPSQAAPPSRGGQPSSSPSGVSHAATPKAGPTPGIRTDQTFLSQQFTELNRVEAAFEDLEWKVTSTIVEVIQRYVEGVVLPSITKAEQGRS